MHKRRSFVPAAVFAVGCVLLLSVQAQKTMALQAPLAQMPDPVDGYARTNHVVPEEEARVAGMTSYTSRIYKTDSAEVMGLYVGFYDSQQQGKTAHSPKNCLPGSGWEPMSASIISLAMPGDRPAAAINRYVLTNKQQQAIVYYWYQGRGRVAASEYAVKWHLLRDAAIKRRTDEALVRLVIPVTPEMSVADADRLAEQTARRLIPTLDQYLPA